MDGYEDHCQVLLKANNGFDFWEFFKLLNVVGRARIGKLAEKAKATVKEKENTLDDQQRDAGVAASPPPLQDGQQQQQQQQQQQLPPSFEEQLWKYELKQIVNTLVKLHPAMVAVGQSAARLAAVTASTVLLRDAQ